MHALDLGRRCSGTSRTLGSRSLFEPCRLMCRQWAVIPWLLNPQKASRPLEDTNKREDTDTRDVSAILDVTSIPGNVSRRIKAQLYPCISSSWASTRKHADVPLNWCAFAPKTKLQHFCYNSSDLPALDLGNVCSRFRWYVFFSHETFIPAAALISSRWHSICR